VAFGRRLTPFITSAATGSDGLHIRTRQRYYSVAGCILPFPAHVNSNTPSACRAPRNGASCRGMIETDSNCRWSGWTWFCSNRFFQSARQCRKIHTERRHDYRKSPPRRWAHAHPDLGLRRRFTRGRSRTRLRQFYRVWATDKKHAGTRLDLAIGHGLMEAMSGTIAAATRNDRSDVVFILTLPIVLS